jgi:hypothetical protein
MQLALFVIPLAVSLTQVYKERIDNESEIKEQDL